MASEPNAAMVELAARSDCAFDGRTFDVLGAADKKRYLDRSRAALSVTLSSQEAEIERLTTALAFADEQTKKLEALLEPHIKWDLTPLPEGGNAQ